jgi:hypothetical protein
MIAVSPSSCFPPPEPAATPKDDGFLVVPKEKRNFFGKWKKKEPKMMDFVIGGPDHSSFRKLDSAKVMSEESQKLQAALRTSGDKNATTASIIIPNIAIPITVPSSISTPPSGRTPTPPTTPIHAHSNNDNNEDSDHPKKPKKKKPQWSP